MYTETIDWAVLGAIRVTENDTTASSRIFIKILFEELSENLGMELFKARLNEETLQPHLTGIFPRDSAENARFAINFFTSFGLGAITVELREWLKTAPVTFLHQKLKEYKELNELSDSDSDSSSSSSSSKSDSGSKSDDSSKDGKESKNSGSKRKASESGSDSESKKNGSSSKKSSSSSSRKSSVSSESD
jgi:pre-mRNA-splicing factor CWC22